VQETFVHAYAQLDQLRDPTRFSSWLYAIARNTAYQSLRQDARNRHVLTELDDFEDLRAGPVELAELAELAGRIEAAGALLSQRDATALTMTVTFGFGPAELAVALGVTEGNAKVILHRARRRLSALLDPKANFVTEELLPRREHR
jgi:RNA polymerase sigma-70 factor (ECF subfamily)